MSDTETDWAERRNALRQRTFKRGRVVVKGVETMHCVIRNMSLTGARIAVPNSAALPDRFVLFIGDEGTQREVEVMSRSDTSAGLRFTKPLSARELGAEFMSHRSTTQHRAERTAARAPARPHADVHADAHADVRAERATADVGPAAPDPAALPNLAPPPVDGPGPVPAERPAAPAIEPNEETLVALRKIRPAPLPFALAQRLPWGA